MVLRQFISIVSLYVVAMFSFIASWMDILIICFLFVQGYIKLIMPASLNPLIAID